MPSTTIRPQGAPSIPRLRVPGLLLLTVLLVFHTVHADSGDDGYWGDGNVGEAPEVAYKDQCHVYGDPHYRTFDGKVFHFMGRCKYKLVCVLPSAVAAGLEDFSIYGQNEYRYGNTRVSWIKYVELILKEEGKVKETIRIDKNRDVTVDSGAGPVTYSPPPNQQTTPSGVTITWYYGWVWVQTTFGVTVCFDGRNHYRIKLTKKFRDCVYGLCQDFDNDPSNDHQRCDGESTTQSTPNLYTLIGNSCKVDSDSCSDPDADHELCSGDAAKVALVQKEEYCGIITKTGGPFAPCLGQFPSETTTRYYESCQIDVCERDAETDRQAAKCDVLFALAELCRTVDEYPTDWRTTTSCSFETTCTAPLVYLPSASTCEKTCQAPLAEDECTWQDDVERCGCPADQYRHENECIASLDKCPCEDPDGRRGMIGDSWYNAGCTKLYKCSQSCSSDGATCTAKLDTYGASCLTPNTCQQQEDGSYKCLTPVPGGWSTWSYWSTCDATQNPRTRTRTCTRPTPANGGAGCSGSSADTETSNSCITPIPGGWTPWGAYTTCSYPYKARGRRTRTRSCTNPRPQYGGATCPGSASQEVQCGCFFPYGQLYYRDRVAYFSHPDDGATRPIRAPQSIRFFSGLYRTFIIHVNGYTSLHRSYWGYFPRYFPIRGWSYAILSPFWADIAAYFPDIQAEDNVVFYQVYERYSSRTPLTANQQLVFDYATELVRTKHSDYSFYPTQVIVVTYSRMIPAPFWRYRFISWRNTFQLVMMQDSRTLRSYIVFLYEENSWSSVVAFPNWIGYMGSGGEFYNHPASFTRQAFNMAQLTAYPGSGGTCGLIVRRTSYRHLEVRSNPWFACLVWEEQQRLLYARTISFYDRLLPDCPCNWFQARWDPRYMRIGGSSFNRALQCFVTSRVNPWVGLLGSRICCYHAPLFRFWFGWRWRWGFGRLARSSRWGYGSITLYHPFFYFRLWLAHDYYGQNLCCRLSSQCWMYYRRRPQSSCRRYRSPWIFWVGGDPHITTNDGKSYIFNGHGEYWAIKTTDDVFSLQARTIPALGKDGKEIAATIFGAFAAASANSSQVHVELNEARTGLLIKINHDNDVTEWFYDAETIGNIDNQINNKDGVVLSRDIFADDPTLDVQFPDAGVKLRFTAKANQLSVTNVLSDELQGLTRGLYGVFNGDPDDDFTLPDGSKLSPNSTEEEIFHRFGQKWMISGSDTLFYYPPGRDHTQFVDDDMTPEFGPKFENEAQRRDAEEKCGDSAACLYDYTHTGDEALANNTAVDMEDTMVLQTNLDNKVPRIFAPSQMNVTVNELFQTYIIANDSDADDLVTVELADAPAGSQYDRLTGWFTWTPADRTTEYAEFTIGATDNRHGEAEPVEVTIALCDCNNHGDCDWENTQEDYNTSTRFYVVACMCHEPWEGDYCDQDVDGCMGNPCGPLRDCTDITAQAHHDTGMGFSCSGCPEGYYTDPELNKCYDVDECNATSSPCDDSISECVNIVGSYMCKCDSGYFNSVPTQCEDVNECTRQQHSCDQICINTPGSFRCDCYPGNEFRDTTEGRKCVQRDSIKTACETKNCGKFCQRVSTQDIDVVEVECSCSPGEIVSPPGDTTCIDIDECDGVNPCGENGICHNASPGYTCTCTDGYQLDDSGTDCTACPSRTWGPECSFMCDCKNTSTPCLPVTGCTECPDGFTGGGNCTQDLNECTDDPDICGSNSICINSEGGYECNCTEGYIRLGDACELDDYCEKLDENPCQNGGFCNATFMGFTCQCLPGYLGDRCEQDINECASSPCQNGGDCLDLENRYQCRCNNAYTGMHCEKDKVLQFIVKFTVLGTDGSTNEAALTAALQPKLEEFFQTFYSNSFIRSKNYTYSGVPKTIMAPIVTKATISKSALEVGTELLGFLAEKGYILATYELDRYSLSINDERIPVSREEVEFTAGQSRVVRVSMVIEMEWDVALGSPTTNQFKALSSRLNSEVESIYRTRYKHLLFRRTNTRFVEETQGSIRCMMELVFDLAVEESDDVIAGQLRGRTTIGNLKVVSGSVSGIKVTPKTVPVSFKILNRVFDADHAVTTTNKYKALREEVRMTVDARFSVILYSYFLWTEKFTFKNGSVDASFTMAALPEVVTDPVISSRLRQSLDDQGFLGDLQLKPDSIQTGSTSAVIPDSPYNPVILGAAMGTVLGALFLILLLILVIVLIRRRRRKGRQQREQEEWSSEDSHHGFYPYPRRMHWQYAGSLPKSVSGYTTEDLDDELRSRHNYHVQSRAPPINWEVLRRYPREPPQQFGPSALPSRVPGEFFWSPRD